MTDQTDIRSGNCLCGAVSFTATLPGDGIQLCHCAQCQRWTGGGPLAVVRVSDVELTGTDHIEPFHASAHGERAFCKSCGTPLYWPMQGKDPAFLTVGMLQDQSDLTVREEIFVDQRPDWLPAHETAAQHDEAEMQAQLKAYLEGQSS